MVWNELPDDVRDPALGSNIFQRTLKTFLGFSEPVIGVSRLYALYKFTIDIDHQIRQQNTTIFALLHHTTDCYLHIQAT